MTPSEAKQLEKQFREEQEAAATGGSPGKWEDLPSIEPLMRRLTRDAQTALRQAALRAFGDYQAEVAPRRTVYETELAAGADGRTAWQSFHLDTGSARRKFQTLVFVKLLELLP